MAKFAFLQEIESLLESKLAAFAIAMRLLVNGLIDLAVDWQVMLTLLAVLSLALGNLAAIAQSNIKRMLAYSTIAHMGFVLLGLLAGVVSGNRLSAPQWRTSSDRSAAHPWRRHDLRCAR